MHYQMAKVKFKNATLKCILCKINRMPLPSEFGQIMLRQIHFNEHYAQQRISVSFITPALLHSAWKGRSIFE
jgi:hypothetical protein